MIQRSVGDVTGAVARSSNGSRLHLTDCCVLLPAQDRYTESIYHHANHYSEMAECENCGEFVTEQYVRVFAPPGMETVRVCPNCPDMVREGAKVREAKSPR